MLRKIVGLLWSMIEIIIGFVTCYFTIWLIGTLLYTGTLNETGDVRIYVKTNGVHTDLCLPVVSNEMDWRDIIPITDFPDNKLFRYVSIGWGDKGFFLDTPTWNDLTFSTAFNAAFLPSETAMHVAYYDHEPSISTSCRSVFVSSEAYQDLIAFILETFQLETGHAIIIPNKGYWKNDNFYEANGSYHLFKTCNTWTNSSLKILNVKTSWFALSSEGIMRHLSKSN